MDFFEVFALSAALATDLFSVAVPIGMRRARIRIVLRAAVVFALFHIVMILGGYFAGHWIGGLVEHVGSYHAGLQAAVVANWAKMLGSLVLGCIGIHMILAGPDQAGFVSCRHPLGGTALLVLAASVSVDALAAGFGMGMLDVDLWTLSGVLGAVTFAAALLGLALGRRIGRFVGAHAGLAGGAVLVFLSLHLLLGPFGV